MTTISQKLAALMYQPYIATDRHASAVFASLSQVAGYPIPQQYMDFLHEFPNTGMFDAEGGVVVEGKERLSGKHDGWYSIAMLYAGCTDKRYDLIKFAGRPVYDGDTPRYVLLIGGDLFGNTFCLDLRPESFGKVYFWDHEHNADETGLHLVADDFESFVNGLQIDA